ncbi:MAG: carboxypeptidase-like regulatory domain-containing protein, partial [Saprospiraceae bacterium]
MKTFFLLFCSALFGMTGLPSLTETTLTGLVTDGDTKEALIGATIKVTQNHNLVKGAVTDMAGKYSLVLNPGTYEVEFSYTGYTAQRITEVKVTANQKDTLDASLSSGAVLNECVVVQYKEPMINADEMSTGATLSAKRMAPRSEAAAPKASRKEEAAGKMVAAPMGRAEAKPVPVATAPPPPAPGDVDVKIKGGRDAATNYYIDGIRISGSMPPVRDVEELKIRSGLVELADDITPLEKALDEPSPGAPAPPTPRAGLLTAGEWNDLHNWSN